MFEDLTFIGTLRQCAFVPHFWDVAALCAATALMGVVWVVRSSRLWAAFSLLAAISISLSAVASSLRAPSAAAIVIVEAFWASDPDKQQDLMTWTRENWTERGVSLAAWVRFVKAFEVCRGAVDPVSCTAGSRGQVPVGLAVEAVEQMAGLRGRTPRPPSRVELTQP